MAGLLDRVITENYIGGFDMDVPTSFVNEANERIGDCDDSGNMMQYTGECLMGMLAIEAVISQKEGEVAVEYMAKRANGADAMTLEAVVATFEGFLGDAWEKIKEWVKKAYTAIKNFLIKVWNKIKGYANTIKAFFTKYGDVLRNMNDSGVKVTWGTINIGGAKETYDHYYKIISAIQQQLKTANYMDDPKNKGAGAAPDSQIQTHFDGSAQGSQGAMPKPHDIQTMLNDKIYKNSSNGYTTKEVEFSTIRADAIEAADIGGTQKYINNFLQLGDQGMKYDLDVINTGKKSVEKGADKMKEKQSKLLAAIRRCINAKLELHRTCSSALTQAAKRMISQSVAACRKAIMYHSTKGKGATPTADSWNPSFEGATLDGMLSELI